MIRDQFYIDDHALLYGLLAKCAEDAMGEAGYIAAKQATIRYARERGLRMAMRAANDGAPLTVQSYFAYKEWVDTKQWSKGEIISITKEYRHKALVCGWNDTWRKHGLLRYGALYCSYVDENLVYGFNPEMVLQIPTVLTHDDACCEFNWGDAGFATDADLAALEKETALHHAARTKDFLYHTAHVLSTMRAVYLLEFGLTSGNQIVQDALKAYAQLQGKEKADALQAKAAETNFLYID